MKLSDLFDQLTYGELTQLELAGADGVGITEDNHKRVVPHINLGLLELYKRFPIRIQEIVIQQYEQIQLYTLHSRYAQSNTESPEPYKYLMDSHFQPFTDNIIKIEKVFDEGGQELHLNIGDSSVGHSELHLTTSKMWSVHTPSYNQVQIPYPMAENSLLVEYRAYHDKIMLPIVDVDSIEVEIPAALLEALLLYIAARVFTSMGGESVQMGGLYMQKFETSLLAVEKFGLFNVDSYENQQLEVNGWV